MKVKCTYCNTIMDEDDLIYEEEYELDYCPCCRNTGYIRAIREEESNE